MTPLEQIDNDMQIAYCADIIEICANISNVYVRDNIMRLVMDHKYDLVEKS